MFQVSERENYETQLFLKICAFSIKHIFTMGKQPK
jgi:hypothetical protein